MKKIILLAFTVVSAFINPLMVSAQQNKFDIGIVGGPDMVFLRNFFDEGIKDYAIRFSGGVTVQRNFNNNFSLCADLYYENKGANAEFQFTDEQGNPIGQSKVHWNFNYITVPILLRYSTGGGHEFTGVRFFVNAGPYVGYLFRATAVEDANQYLPKTTEEGTKNFSPIDAGLTGGAGLKFPVSRRFALTIEGRDNFGLLNLSNDNSLFSVKSNSTLFILGMVYHLK